MTKYVLAKKTLIRLALRRRSPADRTLFLIHKILIQRILFYRILIHRRFIRDSQEIVLNEFD